MTIEQQVADLTTATTDLLDAVNVKKAVLDAAVGTATEQADRAELSADIAVGAVSGSVNTFIAATKSAADALAASLGDGATVIVVRDDAQAGARVRYTVENGLLTLPVLDTAASLISELSAFSGGIDGAMITVYGHRTKGDGGGGVFMWDASKSATLHNGGTIISTAATFPADWSNSTQRHTWYTAPVSGTGCWVRQYSGPIKPQWFNGTYVDLNPLDKLVYKETLKAVCFGDSITAGTGATSDKFYPTVLQGALRAIYDYADVTVVNKGFGGKQSDSAVVTFADDVTSQAPDVVFIMFGINDARDIEVGTPDVVTLAEYKSNLGKLIEQSWLDGITPYLLSPTPTLERGQNTELVAYYRASKEVAEAYGANFVDNFTSSYELYQQSSDIRQYFMQDYIHSSDYSFIANNIIETLTNREMAINGPQKISVFDEFYFKTNGNKEAISGVPCATLRQDGGLGTHANMFFYVGASGLDLYLKTVVYNQSATTFTATIDGVAYVYKNNATAGVFDSDVLLATNLSIGYHSVEILADDLTFENSTDKLILWGAELRKPITPQIKKLGAAGSISLYKDVAPRVLITDGATGISTRMLPESFIACPQGSVLQIECDITMGVAGLKGINWFGGGRSEDPTALGAGLAFYFGASNTVFLLRVNDYALMTFNTLSSASFTYTTGTKYAVRVVHDLAANNIKCYIDGVEKINFTTTDTVTSGCFGFTSGGNASSATGLFENFRYAIEQ